MHALMGSLLLIHAIVCTTFLIGLYLLIYLFIPAIPALHWWDSLNIMAFGNLSHRLKALSRSPLLTLSFGEYFWHISGRQWIAQFSCMQHFKLLMPEQHSWVFNHHSFIFSLLFLFLKKTLSGFWVSSNNNKKKVLKNT